MIIDNPTDYKDTSVRQRTFKGNHCPDTNRQNILRSSTNGFKVELETIGDIKIITTYFKDGSRHMSFFKGDVYVRDQYNGSMVSDVNAEIHYSTSENAFPYYSVLAGKDRKEIKRVGAYVDYSNYPQNPRGAIALPLIQNDDLKGLSEKEIISHIIETLQSFVSAPHQYKDTVNISTLWNDI